MRDKRIQNAKSKTKAGESRPNGITAEKSLIHSPAFSLERRNKMAAVKYQITMEVEVEIDNINNKKTNRTTVKQLADYIKKEMNNSINSSICFFIGARMVGIEKVGKVEVERIGATGVVRKPSKGDQHRAIVT